MRLDSTLCTNCLISIVSPPNLQAYSPNLAKILAGVPDASLTRKGRLGLDCLMGLYDD
jgi:hypothetical protein